MTGKPSALRYAKRSYAHFLVSIIVELIGDLGSMHRMNNRSALLRLAKEIDFFIQSPLFYSSKNTACFLLMSNLPSTDLTLQCSILSRDSARSAV